MSQPATSTLKVNPPLGLRPSLENARIADLHVDPTYQRSIDNESSKALIRRIAMYWDWSLFHPLSVSRRSDGSMWVVDGQHRLAAAGLRPDMFDLPCVVTSYQSTSEEAASFVAMNIQRRALSALDLFRAALAASDGSASEIDVMIRAAGLQLAKHSNFTAWQPGEISNIGGIKACHRKYGREVTATALLALATAFRGQILRYGGTIFSALGEFIGRKAYGASLDPDLLAEVLASDTQQAWVIQIEARRAKLGMQRAAAGADVFAEAYGQAAESDQGPVGYAEGGYTTEGDTSAFAARAFAARHVTTISTADAILSQEGLSHLVTAKEASPPPAPASAGKAPVKKPVAQPVTKPTASTSAPKVVSPAGTPNTVRQQRPTVPLRLTQRIKKPEALPELWSKAWCKQCDRQRGRMEIVRCGDKFCPFDKGAV